ncbi:hypothetical protein ACOTTU_13135 [Roseobacter sp. EG26]|uniref:hypothetical protein n=1 Tax=Roseobacter sp. EG26 TaxID=3412477 RepID=UPI003CE5C492
MAEKNKNKRSSNAPWSDTELQISVDAYLFLLRLEAAAVPFSAMEQEKQLSSGPLANRNEASVRYRLRNISHVLEERGETPLSAYSAAPQVGKNVKARIQKLLDERESTLRSVRQLGMANDSGVVDLRDVLAGLNQLRDMISSLKHEPQVIAGIGHNNPPEDIVIGVEDYSEAIEAISHIEDAVKGDTPDISVVASSTSILVKLGMKSALWLGQRLTDFAKAGAIAAGTSAGLSLSGIGGKIVEALQQVFAYLF